MYVLAVNGRHRWYQTFSVLLVHTPKYSCITLAGLWKSSIKPLIVMDCYVGPISWSSSCSHFKSFTSFTLDFQHGRYIYLYIGVSCHKTCWVFVECTETTVSVSLNSLCSWEIYWKPMAMYNVDCLRSLYKVMNKWFSLVNA